MLQCFVRYISSSLLDPSLFMTVTSSPKTFCSLEASWHFTHTQGVIFLESEALRVTTLELSALPYLTWKAFTEFYKAEKDIKDKK